MSSALIIELLRHHRNEADDAEQVATEGQNDQGWWAARAKKHREYLQLLESKFIEIDCAVCDGKGWYSSENDKGEQIQVQCRDCAATGKLFLD